MKRFGYVLIAIGLALLTYFIILLMQSHNSFHSPIPQENGVKVIYITPGS